jgi:hypothetical protein
MTFKKGFHFGHRCGTLKAIYSPIQIWGADASDVCTQNGTHGLFGDVRAI